MQFLARLGKTSRAELDRIIPWLRNQNANDGAELDGSSPGILPSLSRRSLLKIAVGGAGVVALGSASRLLPLPKSQNAPWSEGGVRPLARSQFTAALGEVFKVQEHPLKVVDMTLVEVSPLPGEVGIHSEWSFSLLFAASTEIQLQQETYQVNHPKLGDFPLFLVPMGMDKRSPKYEAVFNQVTS